MDIAKDKLKSFVFVEEIETDSEGSVFAKYKHVQNQQFYMLKKVTLVGGSQNNLLEREISVLKAVNSPFILQFNGFFDETEGKY